MNLIICADDFAQSEAIDNGIIKLIEINRLSAVSCMTLSPRWHKAAKKLTPNIRKKASIGLHLDFTHFGNSISHQKILSFISCASFCIDLNTLDSDSKIFSN